MGRCTGGHQAGAERVYFAAIEFNVCESEPACDRRSHDPECVAGADALTSLAMVRVLGRGDLPMLVPGRQCIDRTCM
jgi:hypothetical protein